MGRKVRTRTRGSMRREVDLARAKEKRRQEQKKIWERLGRGRHNSETFRSGDKVRIQNPKTLKWDLKGIIMRGITQERVKKPTSYVIATEAGEEFLRNGKFLRLRQHDHDNQLEETADSEERQEEKAPAVRRSVCFRNHGSRELGTGRGAEPARSCQH